MSRPETIAVFIEDGAFYAQLEGGGINGQPSTKTGVSFRLCPVHANSKIQTHTPHYPPPPAVVRSMRRLFGLQRTHIVWERRYTAWGTSMEWYWAAIYRLREKRA